MQERAQSVFASSRQAVKRYDDSGFQFWSEEK
jgi:hypothetical protein